MPFIIGIAVSSNLQGAATLVGDTTAIMLGSYANMSFLDFFFYKGRPGIFWAVELGAVASACILAFLFRKEKGAIPKSGSPDPGHRLCPHRAFGGHDRAADLGLLHPEQARLSPTA